MKRNDFFRLDEESLCLATVGERLRSLPVLRATVIQGDGSTSERDLVCVVVRRTQPNIQDFQVWADRITGTLFSQATGQCLSSSKVRLAGPPRPKSVPMAERKRPLRGPPLRVNPSRGNRVDVA